MSPVPSVETERGIPTHGQTLAHTEFVESDSSAHIALAVAVIAQTLSSAERPVLSTNFRPGAAALIALVIAQRADFPIIWVDTGFNTPATYRYIEGLRAKLDLNLLIFTPQLTRARHAALHPAVPVPESDQFVPFVESIKLEPFRRAFRELKPDVWLTGIRAEQSDYRQSIGVFSRGYQNTRRVAPLFDWTAAQVHAYITVCGLEDNVDFADPTKPGERLECGLQQLR